MDDETPERATRLRALLALEADRILYDLRKRKPFMMGIWARKRSREPFLDTLFSRWRTVTAGELSLLRVDEIAALDEVHGQLDDLRLYLRFTEDMPITLSERFDKRVDQLAGAVADAIERLGGLPERPTRRQGLSLADVPDPPPPPAPDGDAG